MSKVERFNYYINKKDDRDWFIDDRVKEEEITTFKGVVEVLNHQDQRISELEEQLKNAIRPKFKKGQIVYSPLDLQDIYKGQIDVFDYYAQTYWVFFGDDIGCEWCCESELFKTKKEALAKLEELGERK